VVLAETAIGILERDYGVERRKVTVVPHGVPATPIGEDARDRAKRDFGLRGKTVLSTFGLLSRGKGIEETLRALPAIVAEHPDVVYVVAGATHPGVVRSEGESYRDSLHEMVADLDIGDHVVFLNRYLSLEDVVRLLVASDVYVMAYHNPDQIVSGTMAYALGAGRAVVATPFLYAKEVLAQGRGRIVPFRDSLAVSGAVRELLDRPEERAAMERRAFAYTRAWQWPAVGRRYAQIYREVAALGSPAVPARSFARSDG
jgi:glycosyltransferase involved in cell wall biosynthesis